MGMAMLEQWSSGRGWVTLRKRARVCMQTYYLHTCACGQRAAGPLMCAGSDKVLAWGAL